MTATNLAPAPRTFRRMGPPPPSSPEALRDLQNRLTAPRPAEAPASLAGSHRHPAPAPDGGAGGANGRARAGPNRCPAAVQPDRPAKHRPDGSSGRPDRNADPARRDGHAAADAGHVRDPGAAHRDASTAERDADAGGDPDADAVASAQSSDRRFARHPVNGFSC